MNCGRIFHLTSFTKHWRGTKIKTSRLVVREWNTHCSFLPEPDWSMQSSFNSGIKDWHYHHYAFPAATASS